MKYVITGGSGYIGSRLVEFLANRSDTERIAIADVKPPPIPHARTEFHRTDVRDRAALHALLERIEPDALIHLAFVLNPIRDEETMYDIDVNGTFNALDAAARTGTQHVLVTSSTTGAPYRESRRALSTRHDPRYASRARRLGGVVTQRPAKPFTPVRLR